MGWSAFGNVARTAQSFIPMSISVEDLNAAGSSHLLEATRNAVTNHLSGWSPNVAIVSEPFAGRGVLMDDAEEAIPVECTRISFDSVVADGLPDFTNSDVVLLDDCHYLYTRQIGGFELLDRFLEEISASDTLFVTSWNRYAWEYLSAVRDVDDVFSTVISVPALSTEQMAQLLTSNYAATMPEFVQTGDAGRVRTIGFGDREIGLPGGRRVTVTLPELNLEYLASRSLSNDENVADVEAVVLQKIAQLSNGNPGVAVALWERSIRGNEIAPAYVEEVNQKLDIDDNEAFVLEVLLAKERMSRTTLDDVLEGISVHRALQNLAEHGVLVVDEERAAIDPEYLYAIDAHLRGRRLIW